MSKMNMLCCTLETPAYVVPQGTAESMPLAFWPSPLMPEAIEEPDYMRLPDKLKFDWWRFLMGGGWCLEGEDLAEGAGAACLGVAGTSYTGPSYIPLETPCNPET